MTHVSSQWWSITVSDSGKYVYATLHGGPFYGGSGLVYRSSDYGTTFDVSDITMLTRMTITTSETGQYVYTGELDADTTGYLYMSSDYGITWGYANGNPYGFYGVATSADGMTVFGGTANASAGGIFKGN